MCIVFLIHSNTYHAQALVLEAGMTVVDKNRHGLTYWRRSSPENIIKMINAPNETYMII